jgi:Putative RNA methyltransferase
MFYSKLGIVVSRRLNTCPFQGSRTIRTEEAVLISLAAVSPALAKSARSEEKVEEDPKKDIEFSDESPSDESSDDDDDDDDDGDVKKESGDSDSE